MGPQAEVTTAQLGISRADQDLLAAASHQRAAPAWQAGRFHEEVVETGADESTLMADEASAHPLGASGFRLVLNLALEMRRSGAETGVAAICGGGGQGQAILLRRA